MISRTTQELEQIVSNLLLFTDQFDEYYSRLFLDQWSPENKQLVEMIKKARELGEDPVEYLVTNYRPLEKVTSISDYIVSSQSGEEALEELNTKHELAFYRKSLKESLNKPLSQIKETVQHLSTTPTLSSRPRTLKEVAIERIKERRLEKTAPSTGFPDLDVYIKGFINGHIYTLSGDTNVGKSMVCLNFAHNLSRTHHRTLYFALEPENTVVDYLASIQHRKRFLDLSEDDILHENKYIDIYGKEQCSTIEKLVSLVRNSQRYDLVVIDHIGYFTSNTQNTTNKQSDVMKVLAGLAKAKGTAILLIQHLNKSKADKGSPENNITGSAAFKQDATEVLLVERDKHEDMYGQMVTSNTGRILIRKTKTGMGQGSVPITFIEGTAIVKSGVGKADQELELLPV